MSDKEQTEGTDTEATKSAAIKINQSELPAYEKPTSRQNLGEKYKTFKGGTICPQCGKPSFMRKMNETTCMHCGYTQ